jgi:hypothetical protein
MAVANKTAFAENLLRIIAASFGVLPTQFKLVLKWAIGKPAAMGTSTFNVF